MPKVPYGTEWLAPHSRLLVRCIIYVASCPTRPEKFYVRWKQRDHVLVRHHNADMTARTSVIDKSGADTTPLPLDAEVPLHRVDGASFDIPHSEASGTRFLEIVPRRSTYGTLLLPQSSGMWRQRVLIFELSGFSSVLGHLLANPIGHPRDVLQRVFVTTLFQRAVKA